MHESLLSDSQCDMHPVTASKDRYNIVVEQVGRKEFPQTGVYTQTRSVMSVIGILRQPFADIASWVRLGYGHGAKRLGQTGRHRQTIQTGMR